MRSLLQSAITYGLFPAVFCVAMAFGVFGLNAGMNHGTILITVAIVTAIITMVFERIHPAHRNWNISKNDVLTDAFHALISMIILPEVLKAGLTVGLGMAAIWLSKTVGFDLWPTSWPIVLQLFFAMALSQFGEYWVHRSMHEVPFLWRFHSIHHSPKRLYWLNASRFHPIDTAASFSIALVPLLLLGVPADLLVLITIWITVHGLFQHCNIKLRLGPLNYIFSMAELHRWHHSLVLKEANSNYGNNIILWDLIFGTFYNPNDKEASEDIGLHDIPEFPENYLKQILAPFQWKKINRD